MNDTTAPAINGAALASAQAAEQSALAVKKELALIPNEDAGVAAAVVAAFAKADAALVACEGTTAAVAAIPPPRPIIPNLQSYGAKVNDPSFMNNAAMTKAAATKSMIFTEPGVYWLDGVSYFNLTQSGVEFDVQVPGVEFRIRPNNRGRYYVIRISGTDNLIRFQHPVKIYGDRPNHQWRVESGDKWQEHGYGIFCGGSRNTILSPWDEANPFGTSLVTDCIGDGLGLAGAGHVIEGIVADRNRRQGLSAFDCADGLIQHCSFTNTGPVPGQADPLGLANPFAGIDLEPDRGNVRNLRILNNLIAFNRKSGLVGWVRSEVSAILELEAANNVIQGNSNGVHMRDARGTRKDTVIGNLHDNLFVDQRNTDIRAEDGAKVTAYNNTFDRVGERTDRTRAGVIGPEMQKLGIATFNAPMNNFI